MRWPLRYQILIPFTLVLLGTIAAVSACNAVLAARRAHRQIEEQLQGIAATLADSTSNFPLNDWVLRQVHGLSGAEFVFTNLAGNVLAASSQLRDRAGGASAVVENSQQLRLGPPVEIGGQRFFEMTLAMKGRGQQPPGRLQILYPEGVWQEARRDAIVPPLAIGGIALAATVLAALVISKRLTQPIIQLRWQVSRIAQAHYAPIPLPPHDDEIRALAADVNRMAAQLAEMDKAIRRSERLALLGQLAGGLAHHLRNNITGALMAVQLHARECNVDRESLDVALRQLALTEENLKQFLAAPHADPTGTLKQNRSPCRLNEIVHETVRLIEPSLRHRRVQFSVVADPDGEVSFMADRGNLRQLLMNLALNAAEAAGPGGRIRMEIDASDVDTNESKALLPDGGRLAEKGELAEGSHIVLRIVDNGAGPPSEMIERLFEPFATSKPEGIGLGLAVARQIAQSHGGNIVFRRDAAETCFEVRLPVEGLVVDGAKSQAIVSTAAS